eukprot:11388981-Alexandrium_andersonii.AAC.1
MRRLATRALEAFGTPMPGLERPPAGARRVDGPAASGGRSGGQPRNTQGAPLPARPEQPPEGARCDHGLAVVGEWTPPGPERPL